MNSLLRALLSQGMAKNQSQSPFLRLLYFFAGEKLRIIKPTINVWYDKGYEKGKNKV